VRDCSESLGYNADIRVMSVEHPSTGDVSGGQSPIHRRVTLHRALLAFGLATWLASEAAAQVRPQPVPDSTAPPTPAVVWQPPAPQPSPTAPSSTQPSSTPPNTPPVPEPVAASVIDPAERALIEGKFDEVDRLAAVAGATVDQQVMKARADAARGRYDAALALLTTLASQEPGGAAALERGFVLNTLGRRDEAVAQWETIVGGQAVGGAQGAHAGATADRTAGRLRSIARAFAALGQARRANGLFQEATSIAPADPRGHTEWGELFLDKHNTKEAAELFAAALKVDDRWVPARLGLARAVAEDDPTAARAHVDRVLALAPDSIEAHLILAELALDERRLDDARTELTAALKVNASSLHALAMQGALAFLEARPDELEALAARALAINPRFSDFYRVVGGRAAAHYRFEEAVALVRKGVALDPDSPRIQAELGMHLLRTGDEPAAREALERAFKADAYDVVTYNLLALLDTLDKFQSFPEGELLVKLHPEEAPVMRDYVVRLSREALASLTKRYGFAPTGPILIEMFPRHDDFAVRTLGLPGMIGALGVCFGRVVTLDSPRARPPGTFNWGATLWHELAHVITLQLSAQRLPRWLSEGTSVFEERRADPSWGREGEHEFITAYAKGELIELAELNSGFSSGRTIGLAYHQASLVVEHMVDKFGDAGLQRLIKAFGTGQPEAEALKSALGISIDELQTSFDQYIVGRFGEARTALQTIEEPFPSGTDEDAAAAIAAYADRHPGNYFVQIGAGRRLFEQGRLDDARRVLERAARLVPQTMGDESPRMGLAELAVKQDDKPRAMRELELVLNEGHTAMEAARRLLTLAREAGDQVRLQRAAERISALDPFDASAHTELGRAALARQDTAQALRELELALRLGSADPAAAHADLAEAYLQAGQPDAVRRHAISALEIAPRFERAQELLLKIVDGR
jgi:tetratricopeptide (TPR) repeat protein